MGHGPLLEALALPVHLLHWLLHIGPRKDPTLRIELLRL